MARKRAAALVVVVMSGVLGAQKVKPAKALSMSAYGAESSGLTADGSFFDGSDFTCACAPNFPLGSTVRVCLDGCVDVYTNDSSGSYDTFDISMEAAYAIGLAPDVGRCFVASNCSAELIKEAA